VGLLQHKGHCTPPQKTLLPHLQEELDFVSQTPALLKGEVGEAHLKLSESREMNRRHMTPVEKAMQAHGSMQREQVVSYDMDGLL